MSYQFPIRFQEIDDSICPQVLCAQCGETIRDALMAWVGYYLEQNGDIPSRAAVFLHKETCVDAWQETHGMLIGTDELGRTIAELVVNLWLHSPVGKSLSFEAFLQRARGSEPD